MILSRLTPCNLFKIRYPKWNGGKAYIGLDKNRIAKHNEIRIEYIRKSDGQPSYPDPYYFDGDKLKEADYELQNRKGKTLVLIPLNDMEILYRE